MSTFAMEPIYDNDYLLSDECHDWSHDWAPLLSPWESRTPLELPLAIWQYTAASLNQQDVPDAQTMQNFHLWPYQHSSPTSSVVPTPNIHIFPHHAASLPSPTPRYQEMHSDGSRKRSQRSQSLEEEDEESDEKLRDLPPRKQKSTKRQPHRGISSANDEAAIQNAKRTHTVVEKNYRERLNDKIADLAVYLFETTSDARTKPSKSLVMTRAKERLKQLEARNKSLEGEVTKLRQQIAILDHIVGEKEKKRKGKDD